MLSTAAVIFIIIPVKIQIKILVIELFSCVQRSKKFIPSITEVASISFQNTVIAVLGCVPNQCPHFLHMCRD